MNKKKIVVLCFVALLTMLWMNGFANDEPKWKVSLPKKADWIKITAAGTVIVSTNSTLIAIDPAKQDKVWEIKDAGSIDQEKYTEIPGTTFAIYESSNALKSLKTQTTIIDYITGRIIYNNLEADVTIVDKTPLLEIGAILLEIKQSKKIMLALVNIESGKELWKFDLPNRKTGFGLAALKQAVKSMMDAVPVADKDGNILFPDDKILQRIDAQTGKILWTKENEKSVGRLNFSDDGNVIYVGSGRKIMGIKLTDGSEIWKDPLKINGEFKMFIPTKDAKMYVVTSAEINLIDEATGKAAWKKPAEFDLPFTSLRFTDNGLLVFGGDDKTSMFDYIGFDGNKLWKRAYKTDKPVVSYDLTPKGILFANIEEANMIDLKTGDDTIWKKRIKLKGSPVTYIGDKISLVYADQKLYRINMETVAYELIAEDIKFKGSEEDVQRIELRDNGYLLSSQQNMWLITPEGKVAYSVYYKPASIGTLGKVVGVLGQVYATTSNIETVQDPNRPNTVVIQRSQKGDDIVHGIGSVIANRKNSFQSQDASYMMTRVEDGDAKRVGMVKVDKNTGAEKGKVVLKSLDPVYEADYVTGNLYVVVNGVSSGAEFSCYGL
jgi:outer membrane protein assembly factor BamB